MNICFDLDGPLIDVSDRYYRAYLESLKGLGINEQQILNKAVFWELKRSRVTDIEIGLLTGLTIKEAKQSADSRRVLSFKTEFLTLDKLFSDVYDVLNKLKSKDITIFLVTLRRKSQLYFAVKQFKLNRYFHDSFLYALDEDVEFQGDIHHKYMLLFNATKQLALNPANTIIVGDTETEIYAGRLAGYGKTISITRGMRSREGLHILNPDYIIDDLSGLLSLF